MYLQGYRSWGISVGVWVLPGRLAARQRWAGERMVAQVATMGAARLTPGLSDVLGIVGTPAVLVRIWMAPHSCAAVSLAVSCSRGVRVGIPSAASTMSCWAGLGLYELDGLVVSCSSASVSSWCVTFVRVMASVVFLLCSCFVCTVGVGHVSDCRPWDGPSRVHTHRYILQVRHERVKTGLEKDEPS